LRVSTRPVVRREIRLAVSREAAWAAVTEPGHLSAWFGAEADLDLRPGGEARFRWPDGTVRLAVIEVVDPPRRFSFVWDPDDDGGASTRVTFTLLQTDQGTRLVVVEAEATMLALAGA